MSLFTKKTPAAPVSESLREVIRAEGWTLHSTKLWAETYDPLSGNTRNGYRERRIVWFEELAYLLEIEHQQVREYTGEMVPGEYALEQGTRFIGWRELVEWATSSPDQMTRAERRSVKRWEQRHPATPVRKGGAR